MPGDVFETMELGVYSLSGWRYILSRSFRNQTNKRWKAEGWTSIVVDVFMAGLGMAFTGFVISVFVWLVIQLSS